MFTYDMVILDIKILYLAYDRILFLKFQTQPNSSIHDGSHIFEIATPRLGYISVKFILDFEKVKKYVLRISATVSIIYCILFIYFMM